MFVPLRIHSVFSKGRGGVTVEEAAAWAAGRRLPAAALTDTTNFYGWGRWKRVAAASGLKPIFGCELEMGGARFVFLVGSREGYWNLVEMLNRGELGETSGLVTVFIPRPRRGPEVGTALRVEEGKGRVEARPEGETGTEPGGEEKIVRRVREGGDCYIGCDFTNFRAAWSLARSSGLPLVWANPLKFVTGPERLILLHAVEKKIPYPPERDRLSRRAGLFGPDQEAAALKKFGPAVKDAFLRTFEVAGKCGFRFEDIVPPLPADIFPRSLRDVVMAELTARKSLSWLERQRARRELSVIEASGFAPYFLIVRDVVEFARRRGILHNLRGSGASSFIAHLLGISHVNPVEFDLYFERFLNSGRTSGSGI